MLRAVVNRDLKSPRLAGWGNKTKVRLRIGNLPALSILATGDVPECADLRAVLALNRPRRSGVDPSIIYEYATWGHEIARSITSPGITHCDSPPDLGWLRAAKARDLDIARAAGPWRTRTRGRTLG